MRAKTRRFRYHCQPAAHAKLIQPGAMTAIHLAAMKPVARTALVLCLMAAMATGSQAANPVPETVPVPAGPFISGSDRGEREYAYTLDETAYGHSVTRKNKWYEDELPRATRETLAFDIMVNPVTNADYAIFVGETGHPAPEVDSETWKSYRLVHPYERTLKFQWHGGEMPEGRGDHPVTMVTIADVSTYARWLSERTGATWRLATELEWEKAMRGADGRIFPWGDEWNESLLNSHDSGPFDTVPVGGFDEGASPFGVMDAAGQVFEWVSDSPREGRHYVKGGSWDDKGCGVCRPAERHQRPSNIKHILIGFRLVREE